VSDEDEDGEDGPPGLPPGTPFYMTPAGAAALREELRALWEDERPKVVEVVSWAAGLGDDQVFFGATVTWANAAGQERTVTIKGIDEADSLAGEVSWVSPVARALLKAREGDQVRLVTPVGVELIEVVQVRYPAPLRA